MYRDSCLYHSLLNQNKAQNSENMIIRRYIRLNIVFIYFSMHWALHYSPSIQHTISHLIRI
ncbi:hypothetical protein CC78DRAFT_158204 [Lojkania enalia]|uniref:Uncharacterized protein n=1 Tax=Lojkania enalia TaxID=147567 RepID=A0A9P4JWV6_9PLEO|nr:hypothetical protein CC78DRAFT_158204 [Didymosphaeria enalia]